MTDSAVNAEELEVAPGFIHENLQGQVFNSTNEEELRVALEKAFDYRGDVTISLKNGQTVEGYVFDRRTGANLQDSRVRLIPKGQADKLAIAYSDITGLTFSGRDTAAGKSWEAWVRKYKEKKAAGEKDIQLEPEALD